MIAQSQRRVKLKTAIKRAFSGFLKNLLDTLCITVYTVHTDKTKNICESEEMMYEV